MISYIVSDVLGEENDRHQKWWNIKKLQFKTISIPSPLVQLARAVFSWFFNWLHLYWCHLSCLGTQVSLVSIFSSSFSPEYDQVPSIFSPRYVYFHSLIHSFIHPLYLFIYLFIYFSFFLSFFLSILLILSVSGFHPKTTARGDQVKVLYGGRGGGD